MTEEELKQYRAKIRSCPVRKKLKEMSKIHSYYMFLFHSAGKEEADRWLKMRNQKRMQFTTNEGNKMKCINCGKEIKKGEICPKCYLSEICSEYLYFIYLSHRSYGASLYWHNSQLKKEEAIAPVYTTNENQKAKAGKGWKI